MSDQNYWSLGRRELFCSTTAAVVLGLVSLVKQVAPPWWFLSGQAARLVEKWKLYEEQGGYDAFWLQSFLGWLIAGAIIGLIFSNVILRGKSWN